MTGGIVFVLYFVKDSWLDYDQKIAKQLNAKDNDKGDLFEQGNVLLDVMPILIPIILLVFWAAGCATALSALTSPWSVPLLSLLRAIRLGQSGSLWGEFRCSVPPHLYKYIYAFTQIRGISPPNCTIALVTLRWLL